MGDVEDAEGLAEALCLMDPGFHMRLLLEAVSTTTPTRTLILIPIIYIELVIVMNSTNLSPTQVRRCPILAHFSPPSQSSKEPTWKSLSRITQSSPWSRMQNLSLFTKTIKIWLHSLSFLPSPISGQIC